MTTNTQISLLVLDQLWAAVKRWPSESTKGEAERIVLDLCGRSNVQAVVVFGSVVRIATRSFDLDLLYIYEGEKPNFDNRRMDVDLRGYERDKVVSLIQQGHDLMCWAITFGHVICEKNGFWTTVVAQHREALRLPSALEADQRAKKAWDLFSTTFSAGDIDAALEQFVTFLTHRARAKLIRAHVYPASRPELPQQLRAINAIALAELLDQALRRRNFRAEGLDARTFQFLAANHTSTRLAKEA